MAARIKKADKKLKTHPHQCERCEELLDDAHAVWLEMDSKTSRYYLPGTLPESAESQGCFAFGSTCAQKQLQKDAAKA